MTKPKKAPKPIWMHPIAATGYSLAGLRVLLRQRPAQLQVAMGAATALVFALVGVGPVQWGVMAALWVGGLCVEALNTAIELTVDRVSPEISDYGKQAKDLGSFAVGAVLLVFAGHALWAIWAALAA
jgi:diacylglycerol kinase (ATP)